MFSNIGEGWTDAGAYVAILLSMLALLGLLARAKPVRYALKALVGTPVTQWIIHDAIKPELENHEERMGMVVRDETRRVIKEHTTVEETLGSELVLVVGKLSVQLTEAVATVTTRIDSLDARVDAISQQ